MKESFNRELFFMKKIISMVMALTLCSSLFTGCANAEFNSENEIAVITREEGSGTRGAFVEIFGIE